MSSLSERADTLWRLLVVYGFIAVLFVLNTVSFSLPASGDIDIPFLIMAIYYWSIYRPTLLPPWLVFTMGIFFDFLGGLPVVGLTALIFICVRWIVVDQRLFLMGQSYVMVWVGFIAVNFISCSAQWFLYGLMQFQWTPFEPVLLVCLAGLFVFPAVSFFLHLTHRLLPYSLDSTFSIILK